MKLAPAGLLGGRFDLPAAATAYFAEAPETALYEAVARREALTLSIAQLAQRELIAVQAQAAGFAGLVYRSAQQYGQDCYVLFDPPAACVKPLWATPLVNAAGSIHRWVAQVLRGSRLPLVP